MRLINAETQELEEFLDQSLPRYAIVSHTWEADEVTIQDMEGPSDALRSKRKRGYVKILYACEQARKDGLYYVWIDTCCIDKRSSAELQEAINSMYRWYARAVTCYAFLEDISGACPRLDDYRTKDYRALSTWRQLFMNCRWFTRGWTLQELIAPKDLIFFGQNWNRLGTKRELIDTITVVTGIESSILTHASDPSSVSVAKRMSWAAHRKTSRIEDQAYSLLGIFDVNIPMLYGEGEKAFRRLQEEIIRAIPDHSIFAWDVQGNNAYGRLLASSPADFADAGNVVQWGKPGIFEMTNRGLRIKLPTLTMSDSLELFAILNCRYTNDLSGTLALRLQKYAGGDEYHSTVGIPPDPTRLIPRGNRAISRLAYIIEQDMALAVHSDLQITREFEPEASKVKFWIPFLATSFRVVEVYPKELWDLHDGIMHVKEAVKVRGGMVIETSSGSRFTLVFGFDLVQAEGGGVESRERLLPGVWGLKHNDSGTLESVCESCKPCEHREPFCLENGCPLMPGSVTLYEFPEPHVLVSEIHQAQIMGDTILVVTVRVGEVHEMDVPGVAIELDAGGTQWVGEESSLRDDPLYLVRKIQEFLSATTPLEQLPMLSILTQLQQDLQQIRSILQLREQVWMRIPVSLALEATFPSELQLLDGRVLFTEAPYLSVVGVLLRTAGDKSILLTVLCSHRAQVFAFEADAFAGYEQLAETCQKLSNCELGVELCGIEVHDNPRKRRGSPDVGSLAFPLNLLKFSANLHRYDVEPGKIAWLVDLKLEVMMADDAPMFVSVGNNRLENADADADPLLSAGFPDLDAQREKLEKAD